MFPSTPYRTPVINTGSRGDVLVVRLSKPVENLWKNGLFRSRYSFVTHSIDRKPRDWGLGRSGTVRYKSSCLGCPSGDGLWSPFRWRAVRAVDWPTQNILTSVTFIVTELSEQGIESVRISGSGIWRELVARDLGEHKISWPDKAFDRYSASIHHICRKWYLGSRWQNFGIRKCCEKETGMGDQNFPPV